MAGLIPRLAAVALTATIAPLCASAEFEVLEQRYADGRQAPAEIYLSGDITPETPSDFLNVVLKKRITKATVYFDSNGGDLMGGMELGEQIRKAGFNTAIGKAGASYGRAAVGKCQSSCVLSLIGGYFRFAEHGSVIGIHRFYRQSRTAGAQDLDVGQVLSASITSYLIKMGADPALFERMVRVGRGRMESLPLADAAKLNVINNGMLPADWTIEGKGGQVYMRGQQETWLGTGKMLFTCAPGNNIQVSAMYDAGNNTQKVAREAVNYSLRLDSRFIPVTSPELRDRPSVSGDYIVATLRPSAPLAESMQYASQIGFAFHPAKNGEFFGYLIDAQPQREMIQSFINHCRTI